MRRGDTTSYLTASISNLHQRSPFPTCRPQSSYLQQKHSVPQNSHTHSSLALATVSAFSLALLDPSLTTVLHFAAHSLRL